MYLYNADRKEKGKVDAPEDTTGRLQKKHKSAWAQGKREPKPNKTGKKAAGREGK